MKKIIISILFALFWAVPCLATDYYASSAGDNSTGTSWATAKTSIQGGMNLLSADGDTLWLDDEAWSLSSNHLVSNSLAASAPGSFTIRSRSDDNTTCTITQTLAAKSVFAFNEATHVYDFTIRGIGLTNSNASLTYQGAAIWALQVTGDITLNNVRIYDFTQTVGSTDGPIIRCDALASGTRTFTFENGCLINNNSVAASVSSAGFMGTDVDTLVVIDDLTISNHTFTIDDNSSSMGLFYIRNDLTVSDLTVDTVTLTSPDAGTGTNRGVFHVALTSSTVTIDGITASGITQTGGAIESFLIVTRSPYTIQNLTVSSCSASEDTTNGLGGAVVSYGDSATGTFTDSTIHSVTCQHGPVFYASQGGSGDLKRIKAYSNTATGRAGVESGAGGAVYAGGWGDVNIDYCLFYGNTADEGGAIYGHIHGNATRAKTTQVRNCTLYNNNATGGDSGRGGEGMLFIGNDDTYAHTANVYNTISWNDGVDEITGVEAGAGLTLLIDHSDIRGGAGAVTREDTYTDNINADPLFTNATNSDFTLQPDSPCIDTGDNSVWVTVWTDIDGSPIFRIPGGTVDIGAYEYVDGFPLATEAAQPLTFDLTVDLVQ